MLYLCMSIAGSIPVILCFLLWVFQRQSYNYQLGKRLLLIGMFFYLVPFQWVKYKLPNWTLPILKLPISMDMNVKQDFDKLVEIKSMALPGESLWIPKWLFVILAVWLCCIVIFAIYQIVKYRIDINKLLAQSEKVTIDVNGNTVELLVNMHIHSPYTVGFIKPSIIVPDGSWEHPCFTMVYRHEEQHWKNHDSLMKLICILIICIHFVNPVAILLLFLYSVTAEYVCDGKALEGHTDDEKKEYARLVIEASTEKEPLSMVWRNYLSCSGRLMRRRMNYMMKKGLFRKGIAVTLSAVAVIASASTILAYEPFDSVKEGTFEEISYGDFGAFSDIENNIEVDTYECDFSASDGVFVCEDGTPLTVSDEVTPKAFCNHIMVDGYYNVHKSNSSGGCTVTVYYAKKCSKCGYLELGNIYVVNTYPVCPH